MKNLQRDDNKCQFSLYKSLETLSCRIATKVFDKSKKKKSNNVVEANAVNIFAKFQLYPHITFEELIFEHFSYILPFG